MDMNGEFNKCPACDEDHPYIICQEGRDNTSFTIACGGHLIPIGTSMLQAFDILFKFFGTFFEVPLWFEQFFQVC